MPLGFALLTGILQALINDGNPVRKFLFGFVFGAFQGLIIQAWSHWRTKKLSKNRAETDFSVKQERIVVLLLTAEKAFDLCVESVSYVEKSKLKIEDRAKGFIKAKVRMNFHSFGTEITFNLAQIGENLTEVKIKTRPVVRTTVVDYGESLKTIEKLAEFLKLKDAEINKKVLVESAAILEDVYVKPFQKEIV